VKDKLLTEERKKERRRRIITRYNGYLQGVRHAAPYDDHFSLLWRPF
jgi:hypothetical protein